MAKVERPLINGRKPDQLKEASSGGRPEAEPLHHREQAARLAKEMAVIAEIGRIIGSSLNIDEVYDGFASEVRKLIPFDRLVINEKLLHNHRAYVIAHIAGLDHPERKKGDIRSAESTVSGEVFRLRTGMLVQPEQTPEDMAQTIGRFPLIVDGFKSGFFSILAVPLIYRDEIIGALHFRSKQVKAYTEQDLHLAERIGAQITGAIASARLFGELKRTEEEQRKNRETAERLAGEAVVIAEIGRIIGSSLDIEEVYEGFASEVRKLMPFDRLVINLRTPDDNDTFTIAHAAGLDHPERMKGSIISTEGTVSGEVFRRRTGLLIQPEKSPADIASAVSRFPNLARGFEAGFFSMLSIPLLYRDDAIGALHFRSKQVKAYTEEDLHLAERIGAQIAGAIANAQLYKDLKKAEEAQRKNRETAERLAEEMAVIAEIGRIIGSSLDVNEVYERFVVEAKKLIPFDRISINPINVRESTITYAYISGISIHEQKEGDEIPIEGTFSEIVMRRGNALLINTTGVEDLTSRFPGLTNIEGVRSGIRSLITVPLISRGEVIAVMNFRSRTYGVYGERELNLAERIGAQIAGAVANGQLFNRLKRAQEELESYRSHLEEMVMLRTGELETKNTTLQELNTTLKVLLKQRDDDKREMAERFVMNVKSLVLPFIEQMKRGRLDEGQQRCLEIVETHLNDIATPLLKSIRQYNLTPKEIKVAALVKDGKSTKEIATILGTAKGSVDIHRNSIRRKLGLASRKVNLQSYLETLDP